MWPLIAGEGYSEHVACHCCQFFSCHCSHWSSHVLFIFHHFRDPELFKVILNYLRTRTLVISGVDVKQLLHEAEYYGISALVKQGSV